MHEKGVLILFALKSVKGVSPFSVCDCHWPRAPDGFDWKQSLERDLE